MVQKSLLEGTSKLFPQLNERKEIRVGFPCRSLDGLKKKDRNNVVIFFTLHTHKLFIIKRSYAAYHLFFFAKIHELTYFSVMDNI